MTGQEVIDPFLTSKSIIHCLQSLDPGRLGLHGRNASLLIGDRLNQLLYELAPVTMNENLKWIFSDSDTMIYDQWFEGHRRLAPP